MRYAILQPVPHRHAANRRQAGNGQQSRPVEAPPARYHFQARSCHAVTHSQRSLVLIFKGGKAAARITLFAALFDGSKRLRDHTNEPAHRLRDFCSANPRVQPQFDTEKACRKRMAL